jgi:uncharacterized membrane protein YjgN (DUF898 family)
MDYATMVTGGTSPAAAQPRTEKLEFTGSGSEYFKIWIVNLLLSIVTLGIYSAWAKVRKQQYFHRNIVLAGSGFDYHGTPMAILKGRLLIFGFFLLYNLLASIAPFIALAMMVGFVIAMPWIVRQALRFRAWNTSYRNLRFHFSGTVGGAFGAFVVRPIVGTLLLGLGLPWAMQCQAAYKFNHIGYGQNALSMRASVGDFYLLALKMIGGVVLPVALLGGAFWYVKNDLLMHGMDVFIKVGVATAIMCYLIVIFVGGPFVWSRYINLLWNGMSIGNLRFSSSVRARGMLWIMLTNLLGMICTLGLFWPWAVVRMTRYRVENLALENAEALDGFVGQAAQESTAAGDEAAEWLDLDLGL